MPSHVRQNLLLAGTLMAGIALHAAFAPDPRDLRNWWFEERYHQRCRTNLLNLGTACEMYSTDNGGRFPTTLQRLVPHYLKALPTCPTTDTCSTTFQSTSNPDVYTLICRGRHSLRRPPPEYDCCKLSGISQ